MMPKFVICWVLVCATGLAQAELTVEDLIATTGIREGPAPIRKHPGWRGVDKILVRDYGGDAGKLQQAFPDIEIVGFISSADVIDGASDADAIIGACDPALIDAAKNAVWVQVFSAGVDLCAPLEAVASGRVVLTNMQKMSSPVLAEHAITMAMSLARGLVTHGKAMSGGRWLRRDPINDPIREIAGSTMLVVGLGGIGTEVARRGKALGMRVIATRRSSRDGPDFVDHVGLSEELLQLAAEADFIVNALPLTTETAGLLDAGFFAAAKQGAFFVSIGRGATTDTDALVDALESGHIAGAGLDVTSPEPLPADHPLWQMSNVIITPHIGGSGGSRDRHFLLVVENLRRFIAGEALLNVVDPQRGY